MHRFKDLDIWKRSRNSSSTIYAATSTFPDTERFGLTNQLRRAAVSIPLNIAERSSRNSNKEFIRFIEIALGSAFEVETQLLISGDLGFINSNELEILCSDLETLIKMMSRFCSTLLANNPKI